MVFGVGFALIRENVANFYVMWKTEVDTLLIEVGFIDGKIVLFRNVGIFNIGKRWIVWAENVTFLFLALFLFDLLLRAFRPMF